jgi:hypothetical protein
MVTLVLAGLLAQVDASIIRDAGIAGVQSDAGDVGIRVFERPLYASCPDAPPAIQLDGGWVLLPPERAARLACGLVACETDRRAKEEQLKAAPPPYWWLIASSAVVVVGAAMFFVGRTTSSTSTGSGSAGTGVGQ